MKFVVLFEDNPSAAPDLRARHMAAHLDFLESHSDSVAAAGPLFKPSGEGAGGMWLVEAEDGDAVEALVRADPFWPTGLRKSHRIMEWRQVFADGKRRIEPG